MPAVWRLITHWEQAEAVVKWARQEGRIAIGWNPGDLRRFNSPREISGAVRDVHPGLHNWPYSGQQLWDFSRTIQPLDLVILSTGGSRALVMEVTGGYEYVSEQADTFPHQANQRKATATYLNPNALWKLSGGCAPGYNVRWTLIRCAHDVSDIEVDALAGKN